MPNITVQSQIDLTAGRSKQRLNTGWRFHLGDLPEAGQTDFDDAGWEQVTIPHTLNLTSLYLDGCHDDKSQPTFHRHVGWYRRSFCVDSASSLGCVSHSGPTG